MDNDEARRLHVASAEGARALAAVAARRPLPAGSAATPQPAVSAPEEAGLLNAPVYFTEAQPMDEAGGRPAAGRRLDDAVSCEACPIGRFNDETGADCPAGTFNDEFDSETECEAASAGYYVSSPGASSQTACGAVNRYCVGGLANFATVSTGYYTTGGTTTTRVGQSQCSAGSYCTGGVEAQCTPGTFSSGHGAVSCEACPEGRFNDETEAHSCEECPEGRFNDETGAQSCELCPAGRFNDETEAESCEACDVNYFSDEPGAVICDACPKGKSSGFGSFSCTFCASGQYEYLDNANEVSCGNCSEGWYSPVGLLCVECSAGSFQADTAQASCVLASAGFFVPEAGAANQLPCEAGYYSGNAQSGCDACPRGKFSDAEASTCASCAVGRATNSSGSSECGECLAQGPNQRVVAFEMHIPLRSDAAGLSRRRRGVVAPTPRAVAVMTGA